MNNSVYDVRIIPIENIKANPYQPRKVFDEDGLEELASSIKSVGLIQPITVRYIGGKHYELIAGERRLRATTMAGFIEIPAVIISVTDTDSAVLALVENLQRSDLNFVEEAEGYRQLIDEHGFTQKEIAEKVSKNQSTVSNKLRILNLSPIVKDLLVQNNLTERHGRALLKVKDDDLRVKILKQVIKNDMNVKHTENLVQTYLTIEEEKKKSRQLIKSKINYRIYVNTVKQAYQAILDTGHNAKYVEKDKGEYIEVTVKIPK